MYKSLIALTLFICLPGWAAADEAPGQDIDPYIAQIDGIWSNTYNRIYSQGIDQEALESFRSMIEICKKASASDPDNYEYLWRYSRACGEYAQSAQSMPDTVSNWKEICREWGMHGYKVADKACQDRPDRPEAFFWRNYNMGMYVLIGGIEPIINAVKEGFLPKSKENILKGYAADKSYLDYIPVYARSQFLAHVPSIPFIVKGSREDRFKEAMCYHREHNNYTRHRIQETFEWDIRAAYSAEFLLEAVKVLKPSPCDKEKYLKEAREWCKMGLTSPRPYYVKLCQDMLADTKKWQ